MVAPASASLLLLQVSLGGLELCLILRFALRCPLLIFVSCLKCRTVNFLPGFPNSLCPGFSYCLTHLVMMQCNSLLILLRSMLLHHDLLLV